MTDASFHGRESNIPALLVFGVVGLMGAATLGLAFAPH